MSTITETASIMCDDLRIEVGQKVSLMGVYGRTIKAEAQEALFSRLCIFKQVRSATPTTGRVELDLIGPTGSSVLSKGEKPAISDVEVGADTNIGLGIGPLRLKTPGSYEFLLTFNPSDGPPTTLRHSFQLLLASS